jgi:lipopolysaccharide export system permease protein
MIKMLDRYVGMTVLRLTALVFLVVLGMEFFITIVAQFGSIGHGNFGLWQALEYSVLTLPTNIYSLFPMIGLLGSLLALGSLASSSELVAMRSAGVSVLSIIASVLKAAVLMLVVMVLLGECLAPHAQHFAEKNKLRAESGGLAAKTSSGVWFKSGDNFVRVESILPHYRMLGITEYQFNSQHQMTAVIKAKEAKRVNHQWMLYGVLKTELSATRTLSQNLQQTPWRSVHVNSKLLGVSKNSSSEMTLPALYRYVSYQNKNGIAASSFDLAFWQRLLQPLATLIMIFLAIPFVFGPLRSVTMGVRIVTGAVVGFAFYLLNQFFGPFSLVYQIPPVLGASLPLILFTVLAVLLMRRVR